MDLLTYGDLESLRKQQHHRTGFGTQHIPGAKTRSQLHSKRYLIMTYTVEFDRLAIAYMAGCRRGGKSAWKGEGTACKDGVVSLFFCPPDERKNPDWSDLVNYLIHPSDWSVTCHSTA